jgi:hypothetical protein
MDSEPQVSPLTRFFDSFLQERNIKWMLALGVFILLASSLLLVAPGWGEATAAWKCFVFLGYAAAAYLAGEWTYHRLGLRKTGTVFLGLTVLLIPILCLALGRTIELHNPLTLAPLALGTVGFATFAGRRVFRHFLRDTQPTFLASYLLLSAAGGVLPLLPTPVSPIVGLVLWGIFAGGATKVARHVFWLTEEHRQPRVFGFFPILLLGGQFLTLFVLHIAPQLALEWFGLACVLVAVPVLTTTDAIARVFQERTGDLVRPLPWSIVLPLGVGLLLVAVGLCLTAPGLVPPNLPHAMWFTAAISTGLLVLVARRTGKQAFVWAALVTLTMTYQTTPAFFIETLKQIRDHGAHLVREERLPFAFYGLTYLPLLTGLTLFGARQSTDGGLFVRPARHFAIGMAGLLLAVSLTHAKAILPVGAVMTLVFVAQVVLFRYRHLALPAMAAFLLAAFGLEPFVKGVLEMSTPHDFRLLSLTVASALLFAIGHRVDGWLAKLSPEPALPQLCCDMSLLAAVGLAGYWFVAGVITPLSATGFVGAALAILLLVHALYWVQPVFSGVAIVNAVAALLLHGFATGASPAELVTHATFAGAAIWLVGTLLAAWPRLRLSRALAAAADVVGSGSFVALATLIYLPVFVGEMAMPGLHFGELTLPVRALTIAWGIAVAGRRAHPALTSLSGVTLLAAIGSMFITIGGATIYLPLVWVVTGFIATPLSWMLGQRRSALDPNCDADRRLAAFDTPLTGGLLGIFGLAALGTLPFFAIELRAAGLLGLAGLFLVLWLRRNKGLWEPALVLLNWQVLSLAISLLAPDAVSLFAAEMAHAAKLMVPMAALAAVSLLAWRRSAERDDATPLVIFHHFTLHGVWAGLLILSLTLPALPLYDVILGALSFFVVAVAECVSACRHRSELRAWVAAALTGAAVGYLAYFRILHLGNGVGMFVVLGLGLLLWIGRELTLRRPMVDVLARPLGVLAYVMPAVTVVLGIGRHLITPEPAWLGVNSLAILLAGGFYFWRGLELQRRDLLTAAGVILNVALALLWRELHWTDPQFFMIPIGLTVLALVQMFRTELPGSLVDPLRYLGALLILVSPVFHIVGGSWIHLFTLMVASVLVVFLAIGLRVRALVYSGTGFLLADLVAMLVRGAVDHPNLLWLAGLSLGAGVLALAAYCERNREVLLQRMRLLSQTLQRWD